MVDITTPDVRSRMMSAIRGKNTKPEMLVRQTLHKQGLRFRLHVKELPGVPDLVFPRYRAVIFVHGCFWHQHQCPFFKMPTSRTEFWSEKLSHNRRRDQQNEQLLLAAGWRVATVWECSLKSMVKSGDNSILLALGQWLKHSKDAHVVF